VAAQAKIRTLILNRLQLEHEDLQHSINSLHDNPKQSSSSQSQLLVHSRAQEPPAGTVVVFMNDSPKWFQRRYSSMVLNILSNIPSSWSVQIFHYNSSQFHKGIALNHGLRRLLHSTDDPRVSLVPIPQHVKQKHKNKHMLFLPWVWEHMSTEMVLLLGGNHVLCSNSPYTLGDFLPSTASATTAATVAGSESKRDYDYLGAPWQNKRGRGGGGGASLRNATAMRLILREALASSFSPSPSSSSSPSPSSSSSSSSPSFSSWGEEDVFFVTRMLHANAKLTARKDPPRFRMATPEVCVCWVCGQTVLEQ
jgi:hypothetical protein